MQVVVFPYRGCSFTATTRVQIETKIGFDFADEQARAKAAGAGHTASWKTGSKHVRRCQRNRRDLFSSPMIFVNSKRRKWPCVQKGQREGNYDSDRFQSRTLRYSLRRVSPLDSVNWGTHNRMLPRIPWNFPGILNYAVELLQIGRPVQQCAGRSLVKVGGTYVA